MAAIIFFFLASGALVAQSSQVSGTITDKQKAAISDTTVTLTQIESGEVHTAASTGEGYYSFPLLKPGHYDLRIGKDGFDTKVVSAVTVLTGNTSVVDVTLEAGRVDQVVSVEAQVPLLQSENAAIHQVVENETITNMPLLDRRSSQLQRLSGFVIGNGSGSSATFAIAGGRGNNANYLIDGGTAQNLLQGVPTLVFDPPVESVQEFNLALSNYEAELGRTGGGVVQMTTKSGTNEFHGSIYEYFRNDALQATPYFSTKKPVLRYNLFGGSIGGPIKKNKTQFFFTYEGRRQTTGTTKILSVPTLAELTGDFSAFSTPIIDPNTGVQAVYNGKLNVLPPSELDPVGSKLAAFYPAPNVPGATPNINNFQANDPALTIVNAYVARIDHIFREKDRVFGHFLGQPDHTLTASIFPTPGTDNYGGLSHNYYYNASGTWYHTFSSAIINELRVTYTRRQGLSYSGGANTTLDAAIGLSGVNQSFFPTVSLSGLEPLGNTSQQERLQSPITSNEYVDSLSFQHGKHQYKAGLEWRTSDNVDNYKPTAGGSFTFNNTGVSTNAALGSLANLLLGRVASASLAETLTLDTKANSWGGFFQDDWRVTNNLTLNLGIRYDIDTPRYEKNNRQNSFDASAINPVSATPGVITFSGRDGLNRYANRWDLHNVGPRVGFAYKVDQKSVVRGGGAILFPGEYDAATPIVAYTGFSNAITLSSPNSGAGTPAFLLRNNATDGTGQASYPAASALNSSFGAVTVGSKVNTAPQFFGRNRITGYIYQTNLNVQREFWPNFLVEVGYLGTFGHHLASPNVMNINQVAPDRMNLLSTTKNTQTLRPFPQFGNVGILAVDQGQSSYNGFNIGVQKRYTHGLQFQGNYTWSKFIDNQVSRNELAGYPGNDTFTDYYNPQDRRGLSGNDVRNRLIANALYELPVGRGRLIDTRSHLLNGVLDNWTIGSIFEVHSGTALSVIDATNNTGTYSDGVRPNIAGDPNSLSSSRSRNQKVTEWFNTAAFTQNAAFTFGNAPRTFGRGPGTLLMDASLLKELKVRERTSVQFRAEALNILNHANLANPVTTFGSGTFGTINSLQSVTTSRVLQLAVHIAY